MPFVTQARAMMAEQMAMAVPEPLMSTLRPSSWRAKAAASAHSISPPVCQKKLSCEVAASRVMRLSGRAWSARAASTAPGGEGEARGRQLEGKERGETRGHDLPDEAADDEGEQWNKSILAAQQKPLSAYQDKIRHEEDGQVEDVGDGGEGMSVEGQAQQLCRDDGKAEDGEDEAGESGMHAGPASTTQLNYWKRLKDFS